MVCTIIGFLRTVLWKRRSHILDLFIPEERDKDSLCHKRKEAIEDQKLEKMLRSHLQNYCCLYWSYQMSTE
ncbi:uncharacterized protein LOC107981265 isoform X3 [Nasonia vitripennis]|uniref:Uncharacterized protein n=1 Tax=Nasonia vitripennis TaxID=7425 RepID=A0A7M7PXS3_NASVI|nr:uncharacterized protein LOC107981265 isoform X3 [Nasonia vitripennis]